jgi:hypothetical protein
MLTKFISTAYNFFTTPMSTQIWGIFRISIAIFCLYEYAFLYGNLMLLFGKNGLVLSAINDSLMVPHTPTFNRLATFFGWDSDASVYVFYGVFMCSLWGLLIGWQTKTMALIAWFVHLIFYYSARLGAYGVESFTSIALFYVLFFPTDQALTIKHLMGKVTALPSAWSRISWRVLQIHLCIIYLSSGLEKAMGTEWWNGNAIWFSLMEEQFKQFDFSWLASNAWLAQLACWTTVIVEVGYVFMIWSPKTRRYWLPMIISLHLGIAFFMGLHLFAFIMIILNLNAFGHLDLIKFDPLAQGLSN